MLPTFEKLNLKNHKKIAVLNAPESFESELATLQGVSILRRAEEGESTAFWLVFVIRQQEVDGFAKMIAHRTEGDTIVWFAYPKASSKRFRSDIHRDKGWQVLGDFGFEPVRSMAIDEDWTAMRFRREAFIKKMNRRAEVRLTQKRRGE